MTVDTAHCFVHVVAPGNFHPSHVSIVFVIPSRSVRVAVNRWPSNVVESQKGCPACDPATPL